MQRTTLIRTICIQIQIKHPISWAISWGKLFPPSLNLDIYLYWQYIHRVQFCLFLIPNTILKQISWNSICYCSIGQWNKQYSYWNLCGSICNGGKRDIIDLVFSRNDHSSIPFINLCIQGFVELKMPLWKRNMITRSIAMVPSLVASLVAGKQGSTTLIVLASVSILGIPFLIPVQALLFLFSLFSIQYLLRRLFCLSNCHLRWFH